MPVTSRGFPYPADTATPDVPVDIKALADKLDLTVPYAEAAGALNHQTVNGWNSAAVTFPAGRFSVPPIPAISWAISSGVGAPQMGVSALSAASMTVSVLHTGAVTVAVYWRAVQEKPGAAPGLAAPALGLGDLPGWAPFDAVCPTAGCENHGIPIRVLLPAEGGDAWCGVCRSACDLTPEVIR